MEKYDSSGKLDRTKTEYTQRAIEGEERHLRYYSSTAETINRDIDESGLFINLSLLEIGRKITSTFVNIIDDLVNWNGTLTGLILAFFKEDRMIYIGIVCVFISICYVLLDD
jgi:hypothetical protein